MKLLGLLFCITLLSACSGFSQTSEPMEDAVKQAINDFEDATAQRDVTALENLLHSNFRVMANRFRSGEGTTLIPRDAYLGMMKAEKIGGNAYEVSFENVTVYQHTATAEVTFAGSDSNMHLFLFLVQDDNDDWKIISDLPVVTAP